MAGVMGIFEFQLGNSGPVPFDVVLCKVACTRGLNVDSKLDDPLS